MCVINLKQYLYLYISNNNIININIIILYRLNEKNVIRLKPTHREQSFHNIGPQVVKTIFITAYY